MSFPKEKCSSKTKGYVDNDQKSDSVKLVNRSLESLYLSTVKLRPTKLVNHTLLDSKRKSKSETQLNFQEVENGEQKLSKKDNNKSNEFMEKTEDLLAKALKIALGNKKEVLLKKTDIDKDQEFIGENNKQYSSDTIENCTDMMNMMSSAPSGVITDADGLIVPKKLINPCLESTDRRDLHRELRFNQKVGKNVLNQKSELQRALEKQKERQILAQQQQQQQDNKESGLKNELNRVIMERQQKIEKKNASQQDQEQLDSHVNPEYLNARAKLRTRIDTK